MERKYKVGDIVNIISSVKHNYAGRHAIVTTVRNLEENGYVYSLLMPMDKSNSRFNEVSWFDDDEIEPTDELLHLECFV